MKRVLFLLAHPDLPHSRANRTILHAVRELDGVTVHNLYEEYPYFHINVDREQALLKEHDLIIAQHPFYWYNVPPLLKLWQDDVLEVGWAYSGGSELKGKELLVSITAGGPHEAYSPAGYNNFTVEQLLTPWQQTALLCQMKWHEPVVLHGSLKASSDELKTHAIHVCKKIKSLMGSN